VSCKRGALEGKHNLGGGDGKGTTVITWDPTIKTGARKKRGDERKVSETLGNGGQRVGESSLIGGLKKYSR